MKPWLIALALLSGCAGGFNGEIEPQEGTRVIFGKLEPPDPEVLARRQVALQLAAIAIDAREASPIGAFYAGVAFNPAGEGASPSTFRIAIPTDRAAVLFFQVPTDSTRGVGQLAARVRFAKSASGDLTDVLSGRTRNAPSLRDIDLGVVKITRPPSSEPGEDGARIGENVVVLGDGESINPLSINDIDGDGVPDLEDADDDDDLTPDEGDLDANGDDIPDQEQTIDALADDDDDRIPDALEN